AVDRFLPHVDGVVMSCVQFFVASFSGAIPMLIWEKPEISEIIACWAPLLYLGVISGGIGYTLQILGQKHTDATVAALIMSLESVFAAISGVVFLSESFTGREIVGCVLMFAATMVSQVDFRQLRMGVVKRKSRSLPHENNISKN
ncbi:MAG: DMT family transporter, partial [Bacillota bacterium]